MDLAQHVEATVRYDGPALVGHEMDVEALAPALLSLAALIQLANTEINGAEARRIRVVIDANTEQKCFQIKLKAILDAYEAAKDFFGGAEAASLKNLLEWLGIIGAPALGLFKVLKMLAAREAAKPDTTFNAGDNAAIYNIAGDAHFNDVPPEVLRLLQNPAIVEKAKGFLAPVEREGYSSVALYDAKGVKSFEADKGEAKAILALPPPANENDPAIIADDEDETITPIRATVFVKTQRNEGTGAWEIKWASRAETASIEDLVWLKRFQAGEVPHDLPLYLDVEMEMVTSRSNPDAAPRFRVVTVLGVVPNGGGKQTGMFNASRVFRPNMCHQSSP